MRRSRRGRLTATPSISGSRPSKNTRTGPLAVRRAQHEAFHGGDFVVRRVLDPGQEVRWGEAGERDPLPLEPVPVAGDHQRPFVHHHQHRTLRLTMEGC